MIVISRPAATTTHAVAVTMTPAAARIEGGSRRMRATRRSTILKRPILTDRKSGARDVLGAQLTGGAVHEILTSMPMAVLALGGLFTILIVVGTVALLLMAGYAFWKMRSDDFWEEQG